MPLNKQENFNSTATKSTADAAAILPLEPKWKFLMNCMAAVAIFSMAINAIALPSWSVPVPVPSTLSCISTNNNLPKIAADGAGNIMAVWLQDRQFRFGSRLAASFRGASANSWTTPSLVNAGDVSESESDAGYPLAASGADIAYAGDNRWVCVWMAQKSYSGNRLSFTHSTDNGRSWSEAGVIQVTNNTNPYDRLHSVDLASDGEGTLICTWLTYNSSYMRKMFLARSTDYGATWSEPEQPHDTGLAVGESFIAHSDNGTWYHVFSPFTDDVVADRTIEVARSVDQGISWLRRQVHAQPGGNATNVIGDIAAKDNTVVIAYVNYTADTSVTGGSCSAKILFSTESGESWQTPQNLGHVQPNTPFAVAGDNSGSWIVTSHKRTSQTAIPQLRIYSTDDINTSWTAIDISQPPYPTFSAPAAVPVNGQGYLAVYDTTSSTIAALQNRDGGSSWTGMEFPRGAAQYFGKNDLSRDFKITAGEHGTMVGVWSADCDCRPELTIVRSTNYGSTWSSPLVIPFYSQIQVAGEYREASLIYNGDGRWHISWVSEWQHFSVSSQDDGITWSTPHLTGGIYAGSGDGTMLHSSKVNRPLSEENTHRVSRSVNGGMNWLTGYASLTSSGVPKLVHLEGQVWFFIGSPAYKTADSGATWIEITSSPSFGEFNDSDHQGTIVGISHQLEKNDHQQTANHAIHLSSFTGNTAAPAATHVIDVVPAAYTTGPLNVRNPSAKTAWLGGEHWIAVWEKHQRPTIGAQPDYTTSRIQYATSNDGGRNWSVPAQLIPEEDLHQEVGQIFPAIAAIDGNVVAGWQAVVNNLGSYPYEEEAQFFYSFATIEIDGSSGIVDWQLFN